MNACIEVSGNSPEAFPASMHALWYTTSKPSWPIVTALPLRSKSSPALTPHASLKHPLVPRRPGSAVSLRNHFSSPFSAPPAAAFASSPDSLSVSPPSRRSSSSFRVRFGCCPDDPPSAPSWVLALRIRPGTNPPVRSGPWIKERREPPRKVPPVWLPEPCS